MGDIQAGIHIVVAQGQLFVEIQVLGSQLGTLFVNVELVQEGSDFLLVQQVQRFYVVGVGHAGLAGIFLQSVDKCLCLEGLVIRICAGINDCDPASGSGIAVQPGSIRADNTGGGIHLWLGDVFRPGGFCGSILLLQADVLDAVHLSNGLQFSIGHVGGDEIAHQGQVPDDVQSLSPQYLTGNVLGDDLLLGLQAFLIGHCLVILGNGHGGIAGLNGGLLLQDDGDTDDIRISVGRLLRFILDQAVSQIRRNGTVYLFPAEPGGLNRNCKGCNQGQDQKHGKKSGKYVLFHDGVTSPSESFCTKDDIGLAAVISLMNMLHFCCVAKEALCTISYILQQECIICKCILIFLHFLQIW